MQTHANSGILQANVRRKGLESGRGCNRLKRRIAEASCGRPASILFRESRVRAASEIPGQNDRFDANPSHVNGRGTPSALTRRGSWYETSQNDCI